MKGESGTGEIAWDGKNESGEKVETGIYLYKITETNGDTITGKIGVTK